MDSTFPVIVMEDALSLSLVAAEEYSHTSTEVMASEVALLMAWITVVMFLTIKMKGVTQNGRQTNPPIIQP